MEKLRLRDLLPADSSIPLRYWYGPLELVQYLEQFADLTQVILSIVDLKTRRAIYTSQNAAVPPGLRREEIAADPPPWPPPPALYRKYLARAARLADGQVFEAEYHVSRRDGRCHWLHCRFTPFRRGERGEVLQIAVATTDVTTRKRAAEAFRASEGRFRRYFELGLTGMAILSPEHECLEVNGEICRILGYERDELLRKTWAEMTHPDDRAADAVYFARVVAGEIEGWTLEKKWIRKDSTVIDSTVSVSCVRCTDGAVDYFVALLQDITEGKQAAAALARANRELERRVANRTRQVKALNEELIREIADRRRAELESEVLKNALAADLSAMTQLHDFRTRMLASTKLKPMLEETLHAIMAIQEADFGLVQLCNPESGVLETVAQHGFQAEFLKHFTDPQNEDTAFGVALRRRERVILEDTDKDAGSAPLRDLAARVGFRAVQATPLFSRRGEPLGIVSTQFRHCHRPSERSLQLTDLYVMYAEDMIERKQNETALLRYQQELQALTARLIEAQEADSKYLARELHDVFSQRLAALGMEMGALAQRIEGSTGQLSKHLLEFTGQLGALAKDIHRISRQLHPGILDDLGLAAALRSECLTFSEQYGIRAAFDSGKALPEVPDDVSLCLYRIAQECLRNVGKHAAAAQVRVNLSGSQDEIALEIADSGHGFDAAEIKRNGGLGLVSMEERARLVNGTLSIRSQPGKGTSVKVCVPVHGGQS